MRFPRPDNQRRNQDQPQSRPTTKQDIRSRKVVTSRPGTPMPMIPIPEGPSPSLEASGKQVIR